MTQETLSVTQAYTGKTLAELTMHNSIDVDAMLSTAKKSTSSRMSASI